MTQDPATAPDTAPAAARAAGPGARVLGELHETAAEIAALEPRWARRLARRAGRVLLWTVLSVYLLFCATVLLLRHVILPDIRAYRGEIEQAVSAAIGLPVTITDLQAGWQGLRPRLSLKDVTVSDKTGRPALQLPEVNATLSWESVPLAQLRLAALEILRPDLEIRRDAAGKLTVAGLEIDDRKGKGGFADWVLEQPQIVVRGAEIRWHDELRKAPELALSNLDLALQRSGRLHRFGLRAIPPTALAAPIDVRGSFETAAFAGIADTDRWRGELFVRVAEADLAAWPAWLDYPVSISRGTGALRAWLAFAPLDPARPDVPDASRRQLDLTADLRLANVITRLSNDVPTLALTTVNGRVRARALPNGHEFSLRDLALVTGDGLAVETRELTERYTMAAGGKPEQGEFRTDRLNLETLAQVFERMPFSEGLRKLLNQYQPRGVVSNVALKWQGPIDAPADFELSTQFENLAIAPQVSDLILDGKHPGRPGFANVTGALTANPRSGTLIVSHAGELRLPGVFADPEVRFAKFATEVRWTRDGDNLEVRAPAIEFRNDDVTGSASVLWRHGPKSGADPQGPGWLELDGKLGRVDVRRVPRYLPLVTPAQTRTWLTAAIVSGSAPETSFHVLGDLEKFPFRGGASANANAGNAASATGNALNRLLSRSRPAAGEFRIATRLRDVRFDYAPRALIAPNLPAAAQTPWPMLEDMQGDLIFDRIGMQVRNASGTIQGARLSGGRADLDDISDPANPLRVAASLSGNLADYLRFVNNSPVGGWLGGFLAGARASGPAQVDLRLDLPLANLAATRVVGGIAFAGNELTLVQQGLPPLQRLAGRIDFTEAGLTLRNINGQFLGGPFRLEGGSVGGNRGDGQILMRGEGTAQVQALRRLTDQALVQRLADRLDGSARYTMNLNLRPGQAVAAGAAPQLVIDSNLAGLAIDLPPPFRKNATESLPLRVEVTPQPRGNDEVRVTLGPSFNAAFERRPSPQGDMVITRAAYGVNEPAPLTDNSYANINLRSLDLDAWQTVINQLAAGGNTNGNTGSGAVVPESVAIRTGQLKVMDKTLANVVLAATHSGNQWQANLDANEVSGYLTWREGATANQQGRLMARLARLSIPQQAASEVSSLLASAPRELPGLDIVAENFELRGKKLGRIELVADNGRGAARREWRVQKLALVNDDATLEASGAWVPEVGNSAANANTRTMALNFTLIAGNAGKLLERLGINDTLKPGTGASLKGDVRWRGSPFDIDYASLSGTLSLDAERGQFLKADPGIAKLLSVLSLQALPRRMTLDFRDVFSEGFAYDSIRASASIENGIAHTKDFNMRGVAATVLIEGSVDLARETQNLHVLVLPQINAATGSLAYALLANPVVGLATFLAQAILRDPLSKVFSFEYNVSGSWTEPNIAKVVRQAAPPTTPDQPPETSTPASAATSR